MWLSTFVVSALEIGQGMYRMSRQAIVSECSKIMISEVSTSSSLQADKNTKLTSNLVLGPSGK